MKCNLFLLLMCLTFISQVQRFTLSEDSIIKAQTFILEPDGLSYTNEDTLCFYLNDKEVIKIIASTEFELTDSTKHHLQDIEDYMMMRDVDELSHLLMQPPVPIAIEKVDTNLYLFIGYRRFKSPVTILHHIWLLEKIEDNLIIHKKLVYFKNDSELICSFDKKTKKITIFPYFFSTNHHKILHVFNINDSSINTKSIEKNTISSSKYAKYIYQNDLIIYTIHNGEKIIRRPKNIKPNTKKIVFFRF